MEQLNKLTSHSAKFLQKTSNFYKIEVKLQIGCFGAEFDKQTKLKTILKDSTDTASFINNIVLSTNSEFVIPVFLQLDFVDFYELCLILKYQRAKPSDCNNKGIWKFEFVAKTPFHCWQLGTNVYQFVLMSGQTLSFHVSLTTVPRI